MSDILEVTDAYIVTTWQFSALVSRLQHVLLSELVVHGGTCSVAFVKLL